MSKNLTLSIKQEFFDKILAGTKIIETREIRPNNMVKYCQVDEEGFAIENDKGIEPAIYDTITFLTGAYVGKRPKMIVKVKSARILLLEDEETHELIILKDDKGEDYFAAVIEYKLGEILEAPVQKSNV
ncbi:ASCH domain-containing protein [Empedobacter sp.]|uniref:ASCH domain-containing protein n=1 Tax=Empedobacter sp. TaxID=1927715 RepID=UPI0028A0183E|nr:ASCH domain-containing protein [Empedobacter sp.]